MRFHRGLRRASCFVRYADANPAKRAAREGWWRTQSQVELVSASKFPANWEINRVFCQIRSPPRFSFENQAVILRGLE